MKQSDPKIKDFFADKIDYLILFILNASEMILELVAARLLSPYFGNSNFVWTAIIGIILLATSLGNVIGGKIASKKNSKFWTGFLLLLASIYILFTPIIDAPILQSIKNVEMGVQISSIIGSIIFFLIPSIMLGTITPVIMKERIGNSTNKGKESGRITATIAIGSLVGTFLGGFLLIPALGTKMIFTLLGAIIIPAAILLRPLKNVKVEKLKNSFIAVLFVAIMVSIISIVVVSCSKDIKEISIDTEYGRILIQDGQLDGEDIRTYWQSGAYASATYLDEEKKFDLAFGYLKKYNLMFDYLDVRQVAMIGGAAYQYPKYFISHFPNKKIDVIEIDPMSTEIAKKYFFLDDLIETYGEERLGLYNEDGRIFMSNTNKKYDAILNDAFSGEVPVGTLATVEAAEIIKQRLNTGGVYMSNVLGTIEGDGGKFLRAEVKTLKKVFKHVYVVYVHEDATKGDFTNWMVIATDNDEHKPETTITVKLEDEDIVLTDDYNPIDSLISTRYHSE